jgi:2-dehydro-3-deoxygluconokinase
VELSVTVEYASGAVTARQRRIVTLGEAMLRLTAPAGHRLQSTARLDAYVAGSEANVAVALACLGVPVAWISALPQTPMGDRVAGELARAGVDLRFLQRLPEGRLGLFFAELGASPRGTRVWYDRRDSAFSRMNELPDAALADAAYAVVSGITPALGPATRTLTEAFVQAARTAGAKLCVDVNYRTLLWAPDEARPALGELVRAAQLVVCSERDARTVFGVAGSAVQAVREFKHSWARSAELVVLTRAEHGSVLLHREAVIEQPAFPTTVLDRFGAGDAFMAGLLWGLWSGENHVNALRAGTALAALNCTTAGDLPLFSVQDVRTALASAHDGVIRR